MSNEKRKVATGDAERLQAESMADGHGWTVVRRQLALAVALVGVLFIGGVAPSRVSAKDLGMIYGDPQPALAMWIAQVHFAVSQCLAEQKVLDKAGAQKLLKYFDNASQVRIYTRKDPDFKQNYDRFLAAYAEGWKQADAPQRDQFCNGLNEEIQAKNRGFLAFAVGAGHMREQFSPFSEEALRRKRKWGAIASIAGAALSTAASVSAADDGLTAGRQGAVAQSQRYFGEARAHSQAVGGFGELAKAVGSERLGLVSVLDELGEDGVKRVVRCPTVDHFYLYDLPQESGIWRTYQRAVMPCRYPRPDDLKQAQEGA